MSGSDRSAVLGPLLAAFVAAAGIAWGLAWPPPADQTPRVATQPALSDEAVALVGGLAPGDMLVGWKVTAMSGPDRRGTIRIELAHRTVAFSLLVAPLGALPEQPPVQTERYAVFYGHVDPPQTVLPRNVVHATTNALANRIRSHE